MFAYAQICVKVDLENELPEAILFNLDNWKHVQKLDYKQLPFKYKTCHMGTSLKITRKTSHKLKLHQPRKSNGNSEEKTQFKTLWLKPSFPF